METVADRLAIAIKKSGLTPRAASLKAGMSPDAARGIYRNPTGSPTSATIEKFARALNVNADWLAFGAVDSGHPSGATLSEDQMLPVVRAGVVEAGAYREADEFDQSERVFITEPPDKAFPNARRFFFDVAGDSMNALKPTPINEGAKLVCIDFDDLAGRVPLRDGMIVVIQQQRDGGHLREWSVKQVAIFDDRIEFQPRSTNPKHKPIVVSRDFQADDGREVRILALARRISQDL